jgi:RHS repeat-associated protein
MKVGEKLGGILAVISEIVRKTFCSLVPGDITRRKLLQLGEKPGVCMVGAQLASFWICQPGVLRRLAKQAVVALLITLLGLSALLQAQLSSEVVLLVVCWLIAGSAGVGAVLLLKSPGPGLPQWILQPARGLGLALLLASGSLSVVAQQPPNLENGFKHWGSYDGGSLDTVNNLNGNQMLHAPLLAGYPQRGSLSIALSLFQSSKSWQVMCEPPDANGTTFCHWSLGRAGVALQQSQAMTVQRTYHVWGSGTGTVTYSAYGYSVLDGSGATHHMSPTGPNDSTGESTKFDSADTTGYHLEMSSPDPSTGVMTVATVTDRQGRQYVANGFGGISLGCAGLGSNHLAGSGGGSQSGMNIQPIVDDAPMGDGYCSQTAYAYQFTDGNGNVMNTASDTGLLTDTIGRGFAVQPATATMVTGTATTDYSGCSTGYSIALGVLQTYIAPDGNTHQVKLCYATMSVSTAFNVSGFSDYQQGTTVLVTAVLADGTKWTFDYDSYGNVSNITLPIGGSLSYTWTTIAFPSCGTPDGGASRAVATRTVNDANGNSYTWYYTWGTVVNGVISNTVKDPLGNDTVHTFTALDAASNNGGCGFYETRTQNFQGTGSSRQLLKQVDTTYSGATLNWESATDSGLGNVVATSIKTTVYPSGRVSLVTKTYVPPAIAGGPISGKPATEKEYDWGEGAPGPLLRETDTTYQWQVNGNYLTANMLDLPASVITKDGSGNRVAETDYTYDESAYLTPSGITTQHGAPPFSVRGNLTTVSHWLNTNNTWISSHTKWYDTGEPYQSIDPLGHVTQMTYDPYYKGAYVTETCTPQTGTFVHCVSGTYDFNTGVLTSLTNENATTQASGNTPGDAAHTSNFTFDYLWRLTSALAPPDPDNGGARAQTAFAYSLPNTFPLTIQRQKSITSTVNDMATAYFDGLARNYQVQHVTPGGTVLVDTTFDGMGHASIVSNPYYQGSSHTSDPTYGTTTSQYDGMGRVTQIQKQDGSISTVSYTDNCTIAADEAGKQRRSCTDALGRLTSVDEPGDSTAGASSVANGSGGTAATGYVTISGTEQSTQGPACHPIIDCQGDPGPPPIYDSGTVSINVSGHVYTVPYASDGTTTGIATNLAAAINSDTSSPVTALGSGPNVYLASRATGSQVSYSVSVSWTWDTTDFTGPSFTETTPGTVQGGNDGPPVFGGHAYTTLYSYDTLGNLLQVTQQGGTTDTTKWRVRTFTYNSLSQLLAANNPESGTITYAYDPDGELTAQTDARGTTANFTYDPGHRVLTKSYTDGTPGAGYTYDQSGVWGTPGNNAIGRMVLAYDGVHAATLYSYNIMGQVKQQWDCPPSAWVNGGCNSVTASYNLAGDLTQLNYPDGRVVTYGYNLGNQLDQVQVGGTNYWTATDNDPNIGFYPNGTPKQVALGNGVTESMVLNKRLQPQEDKVNNSTIGTASLADHSYNYGTQNNGNILSVTDNVSSAFTQSFSYDQLNRLATAGESRWGLSFTYDPWGNFLQQSLTSGFATQHQYTALSNNRLTGYAYDAAGNLLNDTHHQYTFDGASRISQVDSGASKYTYDPTGDRVRKDTGTNFTEYYHFGGNVLAEQDQAGHWTDYIYAGGKRIAKADLYDTRLHASATTCSGTGCAGPYQVFFFSSIGDLNGHAIQAGDKIFVRQLVSTGTSAGVGLCFTNGNCLDTYPAVTDQAGQSAVYGPGTGNWNYRRIDLSPVAGFTISSAYTVVIPGTAGGTWHAYYGDFVVQWADGTVHPLYTRESSVSTSQSGRGQTNPTIVMETSTASGDVSNPAQTTYYYHGDQIGSSRLMTSGSGWPVWQATFLPYGEEYNAQMGVNHYKFSGKERDSESALDFFGARYYSNGLGRFMTPDWAAKATAVPYAEFTDPQSLNLYSYVRNRPTALQDTDGHKDCDVLVHTDCQNHTQYFTHSEDQQNGTVKITETALAYTWDEKTQTSTASTIVTTAIYTNKEGHNGEFVSATQQSETTTTKGSKVTVTETALHNIGVGQLSANLISREVPIATRAGMLERFPFVMAKDLKDHPGRNIERGGAAIALTSCLFAPGCKEGTLGVIGATAGLAGASGAVGQEIYKWWMGKPDE